MRRHPTAGIRKPSASRVCGRGPRNHSLPLSGDACGICTRGAESAFRPSRTNQLAEVLTRPDLAARHAVKAASDLAVTRARHVEVMSVVRKRSWALVPHRLQAAVHYVVDRWPAGAGVLRAFAAHAEVFVGAGARVFA